MNTSPAISFFMKLLNIHLSALYLMEVAKTSNLSFINSFRLLLKKKTLAKGLNMVNNWSIKMHMPDWKQ